MGQSNDVTGGPVGIGAEFQAIGDWNPKSC